MTLRMLKLEPDVQRLVRWAGARGLMARHGEDDLGYALHALLAAAFGEFAPKPFALQHESGRPASLLAYTTNDPSALRDHAAAFAEPDVTATLGVEGMAAKDMPDRFLAGRRIGFAIRARPTVRTDRHGDRNRTREVDAFLAAVAGTPPDGGPERGAVYREWLIVRLAAGGVVPERLVLDSFRLSGTQRRSDDRSLRHLKRGPDARFSGVLRVVDPDSFAVLLARGVGRHRAFGYGMMLLKQA